MFLPNNLPMFVVCKERWCTSDLLNVPIISLMLFLQSMESSPSFSQLQSLPKEGLQKKTVLIIDNNANFVSCLREVLTRKGYSVFAASHPTEACYAAGKKPDLILCDIGLAFGQGITILKQMRLRIAQKRVSIVLTSWHGTLYDIRYAIKIGADDCIAKTTSQERLATLIDTRLQGM